MSGLRRAGKASYTFHFTDTANFGWQEADLPNLTSDDWLHIASLACVVSPGSDVLLAWAHSVPSGISYDINVRPTVITDPEEYWAKVRPWLRVVGQRNGILKASDEAIAVSLHVYQAEMACCAKFQPQSGEWFLREAAVLATDEAA